MVPSADEGGRAPPEDGPGDRPPPRRRLWVSRTPGRVVARYLDGRVLKGYADFDPAQLRLRLWPVDRPDDQGLEVGMADLKAVYFVRSFAGDPAYVESKDLYGPRPPGTRKVSVEFEDGEELVGYTRDDPSRGPGFFVTPLDRRSNNLRVFVLAAAVRRVERRL